ncbi:MAG: hypothetical protein ACREBO_04605 [Novosphingobium sp.]
MGSDRAVLTVEDESEVALLARFAATLAAHHSATAALEEWCAKQGIGDRPVVTARQLPAPHADDPAELRALLEVSAEAPLGYRHVALCCGEAVLSRAHNWFNPALLTPEINEALASTDLPFGKVAAPLGYAREALPPPPRDWCPPGTVLVGRALLRLPDGRPLALVIECYTAAVLAVPSP